MNGSGNAAPEHQSSSDEDSSNEPPETKPVLIKNLGEFNDTVSSSTPANIKQEIKTEMGDPDEQQAHELLDVKPIIK